MSTLWVGPCAGDYGYLLQAPVQIIIATTVAAWTWQRSRIALKSHDDGEGRLVLLPAYQVYLIAYVIATFVIACINILFFTLNISMSGEKSVLRSALDTIWTFCLFASFDGVGLWLLKPSTGMRTMRRVAIQATIWSLIRGGVSLTPRTFFLYPYIAFTVEIVRFLFYLIMWCAPHTRVYRRPASLRYAQWMMFYSCVHWLGTILNLSDQREEALCVGFVFEWLIMLCQPFVLYHTLLRDSNYWRGLLNSDDNGNDTSTNSDRTSAPATNVSLRAPLMGISLTEATSYALTEELDGGAMKAKQLNYALLSLGQPRDGKTSSVGNLLAAGGTARVYAGTYKDQPLAIKLIYCLELTPEIVRNFGREANKLASLNRNKHVVQLIGICVRPPSLAMALELCYYGSLSDVIERHYHHSGDGTSKGIILDIRTRLILALHCSRAIAAMHSLRPSLLHLDIKAQNFLVALNTNYTNNGSDHKLSSSPIAASSLLTSSKSSGLLSSFNKGNIINEVDKSIDDSVAFIVKIADLELSTHMGDNNIRIPDTHQWTAPELLTGSLDDRKASASTSSDIFALGCVFYEIETGCIPYSTCPANINIIARITSSSEQLRPISLTDNTHLPAGINQSLLELMRLCWSHEPSSRPSANDIVQRLITMVIDHS